MSLKVIFALQVAIFSLLVFVTLLGYAHISQIRDNQAQILENQTAILKHLAIQLGK